MRMLKNPRLKSCYNIGLIEEERAILLAENSEKIVEGRLLCALLKTMGDGKTSDDIADALSGEYGLTEIYYGIDELERLGLTEEANGDISPETIFWRLMGTDSDMIRGRMAHAGVAMVSTNGDESSLFEMLRRSGMGQVFQTTLKDVDLENRELTVVVAHDYLEKGLREFNSLAMEKKHPWLLCKPTGIQPWIGPLFVPGETGCWRCLEERLRYNRELEEFIRFKNGHQRAPMFPIGATAGSRGVAESILSTAVGQVLAGEIPESLKGKVLSFDWKTTEFLSHELVRLPHCPVCGAISVNGDTHPRPMTLTSRKKKFRQDGGHRILTPEVTLERYSHLMSRITGVVSPMVSTTPEALKKTDSSGLTFMRTYGASHASIGKVRRLEDVKKGIRSGASAGKGLTDIQARTSCLCEAIERVSGVYRGSEYRSRSTYEEVQQRAFHPHELLQYSDKQYRERDRWAELNCPFAQVPVPFDESEPIDWTPVWSVTNRDWKLVPTTFLYYGYNPDPESSFCQADSNGNAAGNCMEEAVLQGLMELIERDAVALWWYNMIHMPCVDLEQIQDPLISQFIETFTAINRKVWVLDLTSDLGVPVFAAFSSITADGPDRPIFGFGAHLDPKTAFTRALSEMTQSLGLMEF
ncbi:TOMM precursor leader peptide-binding protein, partial [Candidatus Micrarchaeota archaeon]|nr:TOMM precursor leader peptide-binding protein [Candidatus Micrarchaeota archaeon]